MGGRSRFQSGARKTALCGLLIALSAVLLYLSAFVPSGKVGVAAAAGLFPAMAVVAASRNAGFLCWAGSSILGLLLAPDKWLAVLYGLFLGLYPVVKSPLEGLKSRVAEWICKFAFFNAVLTLCLGVFRAVTIPLLPAFLQGTGAIYAAGNVIFFLYDIGLSRLIALYSARIAPILNRKR